MVIAFLLVVFAVVQKMTWNGRLFWIYPLEAHNESSRNFMVWGPFINRNHFAGYLELCIPLGLGMVLYWAAKNRTSRHATLPQTFAAVLSSGRFSSLGMWLVAAFVMIGALFMTLSRGGIIGFLSSAFFLFLLARMRRGLRNKINVLVFAGIALLLMVVVAGWDRLGNRFEQLGEEASLKRTAVWIDAVGIVRDFPLFGTGLGTFQNSYPHYQSHSSVILYDHAHNDYVELLTDTGLTGFILGTALAVAFLGMIFKAWLKRHRTYIKALGAGGMASLAAVGAHSFTDFNLHIPANAMLLAVVAGITYSVTVAMEDDKNETAHSKFKVQC
jgi:O-antigen ligase